MEDTEQILKACVVARKGGLPQEELDSEFYKMTGSYIPYLKMGFTSLYEYLGTIRDFIKKRNKEQKLVYTVTDPKIAHVAEFVEHQKDPSGLRWKKTYGNVSGIKRKATKGYKLKKGSQKRQKQHTDIQVWEMDQLDRETSSSDDDYRSVLHEYNHPIKIHEHPQKLNVVSQPMINGKQLIGDDYFLQLAIRNIGTPIYRNGPCTALHSGLCKSGQTIKECCSTIKKVEALSNKLVIMLGAEDLYKGHSSEKMIADMEKLLDYLEVNLAYSRSAITLCTIPPMANLSMNNNRAQIQSLLRFNQWIREQTHAYTDGWNSGLRYNLIDFHTKNTHVRGTTNYEFFQLDARMVSGSSHPYVLWSIRGRRLAMNLLRAG